MPTNDKPVLLYSTWPSAEAAEHAGIVLVEQHLAACVNILPGMTSIYYWQGQRQRDTEVVMIIKTRAGIVDPVVAEIRGLHPYDNPAVVVLEVAGGSPDFLKWIVDQSSGDHG